MTERWLYRPADEPNPAAWGLCVEAKVFEADAIEAALALGWAKHPDDFPTESETALEAPKRRGRPPKEG